MKLRVEVTILLLMALVLSACSLRPSPRVPTQGPAAPTTAPASSPTAEAPTTSAPPGAYPAPPTSTPRPGTTPFRLEKPLSPGQTNVRGSGPAGVPILIVDITFMGEILGEGTIGTDGTFEVAVSPLPEGHHIGLALGRLEDTEWSFDSFADPGFYGDDAIQIPNVGFMFDSAVARP